MIRHMIFDFGGVILNFGSDAGLGIKITGIPHDISYIFDIPLEHAQELWRVHRDLLIRGEETPKQFLEKVNELLKQNLDIDQAQELWENRYKLERENINWELVDLIAQLKQKFQIHMLTDAIDLNRGAGEWIHEIEQHFTGIYRSYEQKLKKPDKEAYLNVLHQIEAEPSECVFVDDVEQNIDAARSLGIHSILFTTTEKLEVELRNLELYRGTNYE